MSATEMRVPLYRLYFYKEQGVLDHVMTFEQRDNDCAVFEAEHRRTILPMELWLESSLVKRWDWLPFVPPFP